MPIVFVHGVGVREDANGAPTAWEELETFLRRVIAPVITDDPDHATIIRAYWGDVAAYLAFGGASRPRSPLLGMGGESVETSAFGKALTAVELRQAFRDLPPNDDAEVSTGGLVAAGPSRSHAGSTQPQRLKDLSPEQLSDLAATITRDLSDDPQQRAQIALVADAVAHAPGTFPQLAQRSNLQDEIELFQRLIKERYERETGLAGQGTPGWLSDFGERLGETLDRAANLPGFVATRVVAEVRKPLNDLVTSFLEDVFFYLAKRGNADHPGAIPLTVLKALVQARDDQKQRGGEPLIVLTHSMGGQIVYDLVTHFLPKMPQHSDVRIDFWCATASQVGFFEELKLFVASDSIYGLSQHNLVPFPNHKYLGGWWNVWDDNDFISFTARNIIADVDDSPYNSGLWAAAAHGGYLERPSFFRIFAQKVAEAKAMNWRRP